MNTRNLSDLSCGSRRRRIGLGVGRVGPAVAVVLAGAWLLPAAVTPVAHADPTPHYYSTTTTLDLPAVEVHITLYTPGGGGGAGEDGSTLSAGTGGGGGGGGYALTDCVFSPPPGTTALQIDLTLSSGVGAPYPTTDDNGDPVTATTGGIGSGRVDVTYFRGNSSFFGGAQLQAIGRGGAGGVDGGAGGTSTLTNNRIAGCTAGPSLIAGTTGGSGASPLLVVGGAGGNGGAPATTVPTGPGQCPADTGLGGGGGGGGGGVSVQTGGAGGAPNGGGGLGDVLNGGPGGHGGNGGPGCVILTY